MRIGFGYDVHKLVKGRALILGGVNIPFSLGLMGHSDADVLIHAICDALIGAIGEGDIGTHFPDTDATYKGISSLKLLNNVNKFLEVKGTKVSNIDATIVAQKPRLKEYIPAMTSVIAETLRCSDSLINVKATTTEGLGFTGKGKGIAAYAVTLILPF